MAKRITEKMVKAKNINWELIKKISDEWINNVKLMDGEKIFDNVLLPLCFGLYAEDIDDETGMAVLHTAINKIMLTLFTPKAWDYVRDDIITDMNHYTIKKISNKKEK